MSLWSDLFADNAYELTHGDFGDVWTDQYGNRIRIKDMSYSHVESLYRLIPEEDDLHYIFGAELAYRKSKLESILLKSHLEWLNYITRRMSLNGKLGSR